MRTLEHVIRELNEINVEDKFIEVYHAIEPIANDCDLCEGKNILFYQDTNYGYKYQIQIDYETIILVKIIDGKLKAILIPEQNK